MRIRNVFTVSCLLLTVIAAACDDGKPDAAKPAPAAAAQLPAGLIVAQSPADAKAVVDVRKTANDGDEVVVRGRVAGRKDPFTEGRAQFQLVDAAIKSCAETEGDNCPTPWDLCCDDAKTIADSSITVQVVDAAGQPIKADLKGVGGLKPLSEVSVKGKVKKSPDGKAILVNATEMFVKQG